MSENNKRQVLLVNRSLIYNEIGEILLVQRSSNDRRNADLWEFPGGKVDAGQGLRESLDREIIEETGLSVEPIHDLFFVEDHVVPSGKYQGLTYVAIFGISEVVSGTVCLSNEHQAYAWTTTSRALEYDLTPESRKALHALGRLVLRENILNSNPLPYLKTEG